MDEWEYQVGEVIELGEQKVVVTGRRSEECEGGVQRFYNVYFITRQPLSREIGCTMQPICLPSSVINAMIKMANNDDKKKTDQQSAERYRYDK